MKLLQKRKIILLIVSVVFVIVNCSSCKPAPPVATAEPTEAPTKSPKDNPADYVRFSRSTEPKEVYVPVADIMEYETQYPDCNGTWFRDQLSGEDLCIYNSYLYAMENCFISFEIYVDDSDKDFYYIREYLCLDSPFLEQNFNQYGENTMKRPDTYRGRSVWFTIEQFTYSRWEMKMEALAKCREIVAGIPEECSTQLEKMEYLYKYVYENVEYVEYESMADESYFYDAVCKGESICDGYSNMLSLLFNLIGVECCEAMGSDIADVSQATPEELAAKTGHTWVVAKIGDMFYNFDPTFEDSADGYFVDNTMFFAFSDELMAVKYPDHDTTRPKCIDTSKDFDFADLIVENITDDSQIKEIASFADERTVNSQYITVIVANKAATDDECDRFLDEFVDNAHKISYVWTSRLEMGDNTVIQLTTKP